MMTYLTKFNLMPEVEGEENVSAEEIIEAAESSHDEKTKLDDCIYKELQHIADDMKKAGKPIDGLKWKDVADTVKKALVGKTRPIIVVGEKGDLVNETKNGKDVVREVTGDDLDKIGQLCMDFLMIF